jgi:hypothetical protein
MTRLLLVAGLVAFLGACKDDGGNRFPIVPGSGGEGSSMSMVDAAIEGDAPTSQLTGRVCLISDARDPSTCAASGADGFAVTLASETVTTGADGSFTMTRPSGTSLVWFVSGTGIEPSAMRFAGGTTIPVISSLLYGEMIAAMSAIITVDTGAIIARLQRAAAPLTDAVVVASPLPDSETYYDGPGVTAWDLDATGPLGVTWISAIAPGTASLALDTGTFQATVGGIPVYAGTITFELAEIP